MSEVSLGELLRRLEVLEREQDSYVSTKLFEATLKNIELSISRVEKENADDKEQRRWLTRLAITNLIALVAYFLSQLVPSIQP